MMGLPTIVILSLGLGAVLASAVPQDGVDTGLGHLNAFVSAASLGSGSDPLVTSASETRFRFGGATSNQGKSTSDRRLFIPGLDRRERKPTGLRTEAFSLIGAPPKTTKIPTTTPPSKPKPVIKSNDNKFSDDYYYADDEYYYDYYDYYYDTSGTGERKIGPLGALDPPSASPTRPTTRPTQASTTSRPFRFDLNNKIRERPSLISSRTTPLPDRTSSKAQSTSSLAALLLKRIKEQSQPNTPVNNDLTGENREPRVVEETHTEKEEMQVHVTTNTESSRIVSSIKASHSITSEDPTLTTPTQSFVGETTTAPTPSSTSEVTELSTTALPETTSKRSLADISETVDIESLLTGNVNSKEPSFKSLDDTQININVDVLATEKNLEAIQTTTTTSTVATPKIESTLDVSSIFETLLRKQVEARTELYPAFTEKNKLGSVLSSLKTETTTKSPTTTTTSTPFDPQAFFHSILKNKPYKRPEPEPTSTTAAPTTVKNEEKSDENIFDLFSAIQPTNVSSFLPSGYKPVEGEPEESTTKKANVDINDDAPEEEDVKPIIKTVDVSAFLPPGYKPPADAKPPVVETLDVSDFLPPDYKPQGPDDQTPKKKVEIEFVDMSSFLPPNYKSPGFEDNDSIPEKPEGPPVIKQVDVSAFLPPGFKPKEETESESAVPAIKTVDASAFLPPGYKPPKDENSSPASPVIQTVDVSAFLPPGYKNSESSDNTSKITATEATTTTTKKGPKGLKFPKRPDRPAFLITTTSEKPTPSGPPPVKPTIRNIFANRPVTKAFTGWGFTTQPSVPKPIIKSVDPSSFLPPGFKSEAVDVSAFLPPGYKPPEGEDIPVRSTPSTKPPTTSTTTTTTTTPRPTTPGVCGSKCRLFATIKITNGTQWYPELGNRDTIEWQQLANSIEIELDQLYRNGPLAPWYEGVEIDGFHKGSVLVDYYLQLSELNENNIATNDLKEVLNRATASAEGQHTLGNFTLDSSSTDFVVLEDKEKPVFNANAGYLLPQWLIAVIVIGLASLLFILIFGITVLVNRSRVNKRHNVPLTEEMLNELNKSHMGGGFGHGGHHNMSHGGIDNYGLDAGLYDMDAVWNDKRMDRRMMKPPSSQGKGYNPNYNINIYDSWRTDWSGPYGSSATYAKRPRTDTNF